jgi:hypothetical protein
VRVDMAVATTTWWVPNFTLKWKFGF